MSGTEPYPSMDGPYRIIDGYATPSGIVSVRWIVATGSGSVWIHEATNYGTHESFCLGIFDLLGAIDALADLDPFSAEVLADRASAQANGIASAALPSDPEGVKG